MTSGTSRGEGSAQFSLKELMDLEEERLDVEIRARAAERDVERRHEIDLQRLRVESGKAQLARLGTACFFGAAVAFGVMLPIHFRVTKPGIDHRVAELEVNVTAAE